MTSKMKDYKYCNQLFDIALDNCIATEQDRERFMESELYNLANETKSLDGICAWLESGFAETVIKTMVLYHSILEVDPSYHRKTITKPTKDRIKEAFEEWENNGIENNEMVLSREELDFSFRCGISDIAAGFYAGYMAALKDRGEG